MHPTLPAKKYDKIAQWWHEQHHSSQYGLPQIKRAISYCKHKGWALDVGCGCGGRIIREVLGAGFQVTGIDVSKKMIELAKASHPQVDFQLQDICTWNPTQQYNLIIAWDSIFHLPLSSQNFVVAKLCQMLRKEGILIYTFGDDYGEHISNWHNDDFYYSTIGIDENIKVIMENGCQCRHLELDQYPLNHVYIIVEKRKED